MHSLEFIIINKYNIYYNIIFNNKLVLLPMCYFYATQILQKSECSK